MLSEVEKQNQSQNPNKFTYLTCQILPLSQFFAFLGILVLLSIISWCCFGGKFAFFSGGIVSLIAVPLVIGASLRLKVGFSEKGLKAANAIQQDMLYAREVRPWSDLHSVRLRQNAGSAFLLERLGIRRSSSSLVQQSAFSKFLAWLGRGWTKQGFLVMDFKTGGMLAFPLAGFSNNDLESLFVILGRFADPIVMNPDVIALQRDVLTGGEVNLGKSYTKMWEESLAERFEVTNFVPLSGGSELKSGAIKILMLLTCGGMSSVYLARDLEGKRMIVKELAVPIDANSEKEKKLHEMFAREAAVLAKLEHPHIVQVLDHFVENSRDYLVLEYLPGLTLRQHVFMNGPFSEADTLEIARQVSDILIYLHGLSPPVIHRDVTPDNLIISEGDRKVTLVDFGAASEFVGSLTGTLIGKQCYIPIEQFQGKATTGSDLYALGATMYFLVTGQDPEPISVSHPGQVKGTVSAAFDALVADLTAEPEARISSATDVETRLAAL